MQLKEFIAAIDLGTSKIVGVIGTKDVMGSITIHALEKEDSEGCIKRGCIQNVDEAASKVKRLIVKLENRIKTKIGKVYFNIGGQSLQSVEHKVMRQLNEDTPITDEIINSLKNESMNFSVPGKEIFEIVPAEYLIDGRKVEQPVGVYGSEIEATHLLIVGRPALLKNLKRVEEKVGMPLAGVMVTPLAASSVVLSEADKRLGAVLVDFGAATTTVSVYAEGFLRNLTVIPLGGSVITRDISSLQFLEKDAEDLKIHHGNASPNLEDTEDRVLKQNQGGVDSPDIQLRKLHQVILCRTEEIIENVMNQVKLAGFDNLISGPFVLTGGASKMKGLTELFRSKGAKDVRLGNIQRSVTSKHYQEHIRDTAYAVVLGMLYRANENCRLPEPPPEVEKVEVSEMIETSATSSTVGDTAAPLPPVGSTTSDTKRSPAPEGTTPPTAKETVIKAKSLFGDFLAGIFTEADNDPKFRE